MAVLKFSFDNCQDLTFFWEVLSFNRSSLRAVCCTCTSSGPHHDSVPYTSVSKALFKILFTISQERQMYKYQKLSFKNIVCCW